MKTYTITVNGNVYEVTVEEGSTGQVATPTKKASAQPTQKVESKPKASNVTTAGSTAVNAPMPGKILAVKANVGQTIKKGEVILVLEAMKMENEIVAPSDGNVASINVTVGANVEAGEVLATLN